MSINLKFYGGAGDYEEGELGGVQLLIKDQKTRVMFDIGQRPDHFNQFYGFPMQPRNYQVLQIIQELNLYPDIPDLYRHDFHWYNNKKIGPLPLEGIVTSHAHFDHIGGLNFVRHDMPVYMDNDSIKLLYVWQMNTRNDFLDVSMNFANLPNRMGLKKWATGDIAKIPRELRRYYDNEYFDIGNLRFLPIPIDHSVPGAHGFVIETSAGNIGISGDIRLRGRRPENTRNFIQQLHESNIKYLLWEGSLLHFDHQGTEDDVTTKVAEWTKDKGFCAVSFPARDLDRLTSLYHAAKKNKRMLVISSDQAAMLDLFDGKYGFPKMNWKYIGVMLPRRNKGILDNPEYSEYLQEKDYYRPTDETYFKLKRWQEHDGKPQRVSIQDIANNQDQFLVSLSLYNLNSFLSEIQPKNGIYIRSHPDPWTEEMKVDEQRLINILKHYDMYHGPQIDPFNNDIEHSMHQAHITGHLNITETKEILQGFDCTIIPYHCMNPQDFYEFSDKILIPRLREDIELR